MLDKEQKRNAILSSSTQASTQNHFPRVAMTSPVPPPAVVDVKRSDEYRAVMAELESERRVKADLLANLKEMTNANEKSKAILIQELEEAKSGRDAALGELDELQEEFDSQRSAFAIRRKQAIWTLDDATRQSQESGEESTSDVRLNPDNLRSFLQDIHTTHHDQVCSLLVSIGEHVAPAKSRLRTTDEPSVLVPSLAELIREANARTISSAQMENLCSLLSPGIATNISSTSNLDKTIDTIVERVNAKVNDLEYEIAAQKNCLYRTVPALWQDLFTLLNRSSSFTLPSEPTSFDDLAKSSYQAHLKSTGTSLTHTIKKYLSSHAKSRQKISYRNFTAGELALFLPTRNANSAAWAAFNVGAPHYFLNMDGVDTEGKDFLIGRIQDITECSGEPGVKKQVPGDGETNDPRKWWEVKILEKKKLGPATTP